jgi:hypothetical protein
MSFLGKTKAKNLQVSLMGAEQSQNLNSNDGTVIQEIKHIEFACVTCHLPWYPDSSANVESAGGAAAAIAAIVSSRISRKEPSIAHHVTQHRNHTVRDRANL